MIRWVLCALLACAARVGAQNIPPPKPPEPPPSAATAPAATAPAATAPAPDAKSSAEGLRRERPKPAVKSDAKEEVPPEEDTSLATENYGFNPLEAQKDLTVGNEYYKKGNYRAAYNRYRMATRYDDGNKEAWLRLGEASEKVKDVDAAKEAYSKYLAAAPDAKNAAEIRKKLDKLK